MRIFRDLVILAAVFGLIWLGFSLWVEPKSQNDIISIEDERRISETINDIILDDFEIFTDSTYQIVLDSVSNRLLSSLDSPIYDYKFTMLAESEVNAFISFNGEVFVLKGLIDECESPEHLAAVIAHEIGHGQQRHVVKNLIRELGLATITAIITGGDQVIFDQITKVIISSSFSRQMEKKADDFAFELMEKSRVNPQNLAAFFIKLKSEKGSYDVPEWLNSHPSLENRIERLVNKKAAEDFSEIPIEVKMPGQEE